MFCLNEEDEEDYLLQPVFGKDLLILFEDLHLSKVVFPGACFHIVLILKVTVP